ncbi:hypothetical protein NDU88_001292 [Pleurodeles waltl]|uniref:Uncharacterized protein n=1 Tax=Pleurodeles waltl TaxID=8319 RepID=A0AAV7Q5I0_PLEWA|nr:hypothetical protein NDU88_001292 [Pleurodeles waltl]
MIRDQIIVHVRSKRIQEQVWVMGDPKLQDVINTAKALEQSEKWIKTVQDTEKSKNREFEVVAAVGQSVSSIFNGAKNASSNKKEDITGRSERFRNYLLRSWCETGGEYMGDAVDVDFVAVVSDFMSDDFKMVDEKKWEESDREDSILQMVKEYVEKGWPGKEKLLEELAPFFRGGNVLYFIV